MDFTLPFWILSSIGAVLHPSYSIGLHGHKMQFLHNQSIRIHKEWFKILIKYYCHVKRFDST